MLINAYAGSGKTETLKLIARSHPGRSFIYLCFNRAVAEKASRSFPANTKCKTIHSLAFATIGKKYQHKLGDPTVRDVMAALGTDKPYLAVLCLEVVSSFCHSIHELIGVEHVKDRRVLAKYPELIQMAQQLWRLMADFNSPVKMPHDGYLKIWSSARPRISADVILLDEAQDTNPVALKVILDQKNSLRCGVIMVGDTHQSIYSWRGSIDCMTQAAHSADLIHRLTVSFRFNQEVATNASKVIAYYKGDHTPIVGRGPATAERESNVTIGRNNGDLISEAIPLVRQGLKVNFAGTDSRSNWDPFYLYDFQISLDLWSLMDGRPQAVVSPQIRAFKDFSEVSEQLAGDQEGDGMDHELRQHLTLAEIYRGELPYVIELLRKNSVSPELAESCFSTAHRAKGLEWSHVRMQDNFAALVEAPPPGAHFSQQYLEEINLIYVAMTRPIREIEYSVALREWLNSPLSSVSSCPNPAKVGLPPPPPPPIFLDDKP
jgi:hypothetical protein